MLLGLAIAGYIVAFTVAAFYKYDTFQMGFDLGVHEQVVWNTAHGRIAVTSAFAATESYLGIDLIPTELLLAPIYRLFPTTYTLLLLQTVAVGLGAVPVYLIVRDRFQSADSSWQLQQKSAVRSRKPEVPAHADAHSTTKSGSIVLLTALDQWPTPHGASGERPFADWAGLVFALCYLLYLPVQYANLYEFQIRTFATTFLLCAFYALERRRAGWFWLWALLALGCRNEVGFVLAGMGGFWILDFRFWILDFSTSRSPSPSDVSGAEGSRGRAGSGLWISRRNHRAATIGYRRFDWIWFGVLPILVGLGWVALSLLVVIPYFRGGAPSLYLSIIYGQFGATPGEIIRTIVTRPGYVFEYVFLSERGPERLRYLLLMFLPLAFLPLLQPRLLLITLPIFALNLLSNTPNIHASIHYHYQALIVPFLLVGSAYGLAWVMGMRATEPRNRGTENRRTGARSQKPGGRGAPRHRPERWEQETGRPGDTSHETSGAGEQESRRAGARRPGDLRDWQFGFRVWAFGGILTLGLVCNIGFGNPLVGLIGRNVDQAQIAVVQRLLSEIPPDAALTTTNTIGPHAARREQLYFFPGNVIYPREKVTLGRYLLLDTDELRPEGRALLAELEASGQYQRLAEERGISLWRRIP